ncbi:MAG: hypothetical protein KatS3mg027_0290 [Bacteroidia bacterium]|nr:MAG: hypothetical protein KatS3mg027_0290 [Bacteroidia bacterium]
MKRQLYNVIFWVGTWIGGWVFAQNNALVLNGGYIILNGGTSANPVYLTINQPNVLGITRTGGHIHSENQYNYVQWVTGTNTGSYAIPFGVGGNAADYIPFAFNKTNAANITLTVSTYSTNAANNPMPGTSTSNGGAVAAVSSIPQSANAIDRYWDVKTNAAVNADLTFSYRGVENTIGTPPNFCNTDTLKAQNWNGAAWNPLKGPGGPGVTTGIGQVGPIPFTTYGQFVLASVPISPTITSSQSVACNGGSTGAATVSVTGGLGPYSYNWSPSGGSGSTASGLSAGNYTVTVTGANGCNRTATVNIAQPPAISLTINQSTITCTMTTASATVSANGGTPGYTYSWSPSAGTNSVATGLSAGTYTAIVTDANNCQQTQTLTITANTNSPVVTSTSGNPTLTCSSPSVNISGTSTPNTGVTINWLGGVCGPTNSFTTQACSPGSYTLEVTDNSNGCVGSAVINVSADSNVPNVAATGGTITCVNPTVQVVATTTSSPVSYSWTGTGIVSGANTPTIIVNQGNTYTLVVTNTSNGCSSTITAAVPTDTNAPSVSLSTNSATLSCSSSTVQIDATSSASSYSWTTTGGSIVGASNTATLIAGSAGTYSVTVTGTNGCTAVATATVYGNSNAPQVTLSSSSATITCSNPSVTISATVPGTVTSASYSWSPSSGISSGANSSSATFTLGGSYNLTVTDNSNGCSTTTVVNIVSDQNPPSVTLSASNPSITCTNGTVDISVNPVNSTDTFLWSGSGTFTGQGTATISTTTSGTYQVVVTNTVNGCSTTQNISIGFDNNLVLSVSGNTLVCQGSNIVINASGANTYTWTDGTNTYTTNGINVPAVANITYTLTGQTGACVSSTIIGVNVSPSITVLVSATPNNSIAIGDQVQLNATGASNYSWTPIDGLDNPNSPSPKASPVVTTTYCAIGINSNGVCSDSACIKIYVDTRCPELFVPNVFSPNDDGVNDKLQVFGTKCVKEFKMVIFDRWGEKVFETDDVNATWDGTYNGKDMSGATFVYYIKGLYKDGKPIDLKGNFTIVK